MPILEAIVDILKVIIVLLIFAIPLVAILFPIFMIVRGVKKHNNKLVVIFSIVLAIEFLAPIVFCGFYPTRYPYRDA